MNYSDKIKLYRAGKYRMPVPPVTTALWNESDWIRFIDNKGEWITD